MLNPKLIFSILLTTIAFTPTTQFNRESSTIHKPNLNRNKLVAFNQHDILSIDCPVDQIFAKFIKNQELGTHLVIWYKNKYRISTNQSNDTNRKLRVRQKASKLVIHNLGPLDQGVYSCEILTEFGNLRSANLTLSINDKKTDPAETKEPDLTEQINQDRLAFRASSNTTDLLIKMESDEFEMDCSVTNQETSKVVWFKNKNLIRIYEFVSNASIILKIQNLTVKDAGEYQCQVFNQHNTINKTINLAVIKEEIESKTTLPNQTVLIKCEINDETETSSQNIKWFASLIYYNYAEDEGSKLTVNNLNFYPLKLNVFDPTLKIDISPRFSSIQNSFQTPDGSLYINPMNYINAGFYICVFNSSVLHRRMFYLNVTLPKADLNIKWLNLDWNRILETFAHPPVIIISILLLFTVVFILAMSCVYTSKSRIEPEKQDGSYNQQENEALASGDWKHGRKNAQNDETTYSLHVTDATDSHLPKPNLIKTQSHNNHLNRVSLRTSNRNLDHAIKYDSIKVARRYSSSAYTNGIYLDPNCLPPPPLNPPPSVSARLPNLYVSQRFRSVSNYQIARFNVSGSRASSRSSRSKTVSPK